MTMIRISNDLALLDLDALDAIQRSARRTLEAVEQHLERINSGRADLQEFQLGELVFYAVELIDGVLVDPALPVGFDTTNHLLRGEVQRSRWWDRPFIERTGADYEVRCLDGTAPDRPSIWGVFGSMDEALICAVNRWKP